MSYKLQYLVDTDCLSQSPVPADIRYKLSAFKSVRLGGVFRGLCLSYRNLCTLFVWKCVRSSVFSSQDLGTDCKKQSYYDFLRQVHSDSLIQHSGLGWGRITVLGSQAVLCVEATFLKTVYFRTTKYYISQPFRQNSPTLSKWTFHPLDRPRTGLFLPILYHHFWI